MSEQRRILPGMTLCRRDIADAAVAVLMVVPVHEVSGPPPGSIEVGKALRREGRAILGSAEQLLDKGIVVADARARVGRGAAEPGQHGKHGGGLEGGAVVTMQHRLWMAGVHAFGQSGASGKMSGMLGTVD